MIKLDKMETMDGNVTFYYDINDRYCARDIDVKPWVETVEICLNLEMRDTLKSFPNVKKLIIAENVEEIAIPNSLFPNVKYVESNSRIFISGKYLAQDLVYGRKLLNSFCQKKEDILDMSDITDVDDFAFTGCQSINLINGDDIFSCSDTSFEGSAFMEQPFVDAVRMAGPILVDVDENSDIIDLHDDNRCISIIQADISKAKCIITHRYETLTNYYRISGFSKEVVLDVDARLTESELLSYASMFRQNMESELHVERLTLTPKTESVCGVKEMDGVIYSADMKKLIVCSHGIEDLSIPESVEVIGTGAFANGSLENIQIPDSVRVIEKEAFSKCRHLKHVSIGQGVARIENYAFADCESLKHIDIPGNVKTIFVYAFSGSGLESITLNEGVTTIGSGAFLGTPMEKIELPESVKGLGLSCFAGNIKHITLKKYMKGIALRLAFRTPRTWHQDEVAKIFTVKCKEKEIFVSMAVKNLKDINNAVNKFFSQENTDEYCSTFAYAHNLRTKEYVAFLEYEKYRNENAKEYIKKHSGSIVFHMLEYGENIAVRFLKLGLTSKITLKKVLAAAEEENKLIVKSYVLELLGDKEKCKKNKFCI